MANAALKGRSFTVALPGLLKAAKEMKTVPRRRAANSECGSGYNYRQTRGIFTKNHFLQSLIVRWAGGFVLLAGLCGIAGAQASPTPAAPSTTQSLSQPALQTPQPATGTAQAGAQSSGDPNSGDPKSNDTGNAGDIPRIRVGINEVNVVFTVTDKRGKRVTGLKQEDFHIVDDSKPAVEIRSFHAETNLPLQVALLIDASNSVRDRFKFEQESAIEFLNQTVRKGYDQALVVGFDATPEVTQDFTDNTESLAHGVRELRPGGGTALYDALYFACRDKLLKQPQGGPARRAIILLSDGEDNLSHVTREEAIEMAQRAEAIVFTISTNVSGSKGAGDKVMERIADATGGRAFFPFQIRDVANAFAEIQEELRSQYAVSYKPADFKADGHFRTIEIVAADRKNFRVRARRGYYAPVQ
jgi:VWFA-related protein